MCGITGYFLLNNHLISETKSLDLAVDALSKRGPDFQSTFVSNPVGLGHARLSIIDPSSLGNQPMSDLTGRYTLVFNGEIYNYQDLKAYIPEVELRSTGDTEVLLHLLIKEGVDCLKKLNGFFAFSFYDREKETLLLGRDRFGIKPLHYYQDNDRFYFGSEMKALLSYYIPRKINEEALYWYLKLNYLPGHLSIIQGVRKLGPGEFLMIKNNQVERKVFHANETIEQSNLKYSSAQNKLVELLDTSVHRRLMTDVPLGSFLSGGTDSSAIVALASGHHSNLKTFSIGYKNQPFFDETSYAESVAKKFNTTHTTFSLTNDDLLNDLDNILDYIDEPFADSSVIPTYILSRHVGKEVKVALSGDGADELFGGYYKHSALNRSLQSTPSNWLLKNFNPVIEFLPKSRSGKWGNFFRRIDRYGKTMKMSKSERYWFLASLTNDPTPFLKNTLDPTIINNFKSEFINDNPDIEEYLHADLKILLPGDMLTKVDLMSMANSLEVRVPFLDKEVVNFAQSLPTEFKLRESERKRIVQDAFRKILPKEIYHRPKKGFEVPLLQWMRNELLSDLDLVLFDKNHLIDQNIFSPEEVMLLRVKLMSNNPEDVHGVIWALYVFQKWYLKWII